ncbi:MAG: hypothetical protein JZU58_08615 [Curvibacter lanceolatus]|uniref:hypothetical protein n=1 Tax=Curvibacter lanceolatus TaxID=86182 RepID=UPI002353FBEF|nr:hypothetical protein [Curvibacter lanceolatus]MBV5292406.1 hypothetical protein [Curvibacter lanceolatus]
MMGALFLCALAWFGLPGPVRPPTLPLNLTVMGFSASGFTLTGACAKDAAPPAHAGMAVSIANTGGLFGAALLQRLSGYWIDQLHGGRTDFNTYGAQDFKVCLRLHMAAVAIAMLAAALLRDRSPTPHPAPVAAGPQPTR